MYRNQRDSAGGRGAKNWERERKEASNRNESGGCQATGEKNQRNNQKETKKEEPSSKIIPTGITIVGGGKTGEKAGVKGRKKVNPASRQKRENI